MPQKYLIKNIQIVNEGTIKTADVLISNERIERIDANISEGGAEVVNGEGKFLLPGAIDDQVHFREPGLTHKASIYTESKAAVAGGVTSFMEMPNTSPPVFTQELLEDKYSIAAQTSLANYSFYMGTSNDNLEEVLRTNEKKDRVCGVKVFMGSSTGNLLVDNYLTLGRIFGGTELLIATHCEEERIITENLARLRATKAVLEPSDHPIIRDEEACFESSFKAVQLAMQHNTRLHILHISTERELQLFTNMIPLTDKRITAEVCVHHLHFTADDYAQYGNLIKCNPAIKASHNREALWKALLDDRLDVIATDHAPHLLEEKVPNNKDFRESWPQWAGKASPVGGGLEGAAGVPLVQHSLLLMLDYYKQGRISLEKIVQKMSHAVADCFRIWERGYIREGYYADLVIVDMNDSTTVSKENILYKCGWSPFEGQTFPAAITHTFVNGALVYGNEVWNESSKGQRLLFNR
ncbi:MAG: dihydroorotase [Flaviaesturariibacter sp.]|nr:dihydroorotase [Flaviaesturariibacter sp.]